MLIEENWIEKECKSLRKFYSYQLRLGLYERLKSAGGFMWYQCLSRRMWLKVMLPLLICMRSISPLWKVLEQRFSRYSERLFVPYSYVWPEKGTNVCGKEMNENVWIILDMYQLLDKIEFVCRISFLLADNSEKCQNRMHNEYLLLTRKKKELNLDFIFERQAEIRQLTVH